MLGALLKRGMRAHFRTDGEPRKIDYSRLITAPLAFLVFIVILIVLSNMMPVYSNGERMGLVEGVTSWMEGETVLTAPFQPAGPSSVSQEEKPAELLPLNSWTEGPDRIGRSVGLNRTTSMVIVLLSLLMFLSLLVNTFQLPFVPLEKALHRDAFEPSVSNRKLKASLVPRLLPALVVSLVWASALIVGGLNLLVSEQSPEETVVLGFVVHPYMLIGIGFLMTYPLRHAFSARRFLRGLLSRRCAECSHMDTMAIVDKEYVRTDVTTTTYYKTTHYQGGGSSRRKTGENRTKHDVYDYTYECQNCGYRFGMRQ
jgi:hypothetical protein